MNEKEIKQSVETMKTCFRDLFDEPDKIVTEEEIREHMKKYYAEDEIESEFDCAAYCGMFYFHSYKPIEGRPLGVGISYYNKGEMY